MPPLNETKTGIGCVNIADFISIMIAKLITIAKKLMKLNCQCIDVKFFLFRYVNAIMPATMQLYITDCSFLLRMQ